MKYSIEKPAAESRDGFFNLLMKYLTYFIVGWFVCWLILVIILGRIRSGRNNIVNTVLDNPGLLSAFFALIVAGFLSKRVSRKFKLGELISIEIEDDLKWISLELINRHNGDTWKVDIPVQQAKLVFKTAENELLGKQRIIQFFKNGKLVTKLNVELTAWCREPNIDQIISTLHKFDGKKLPSLRNYQPR